MSGGSNAAAVASRKPPKKEIPSFKRGEIVQFNVPGGSDKAMKGRILALLDPGVPLTRVLNRLGIARSVVANKTVKTEISIRWPRFIVQCEDGSVRTPNVYAVYSPAVVVRGQNLPGPVALKPRGLGKRLVPRDSSDHVVRCNAFYDPTSSMVAGAQRGRWR